LGWWSQSALRQKRAVERLRALGVSVHHISDDGHLDALSGWFATWVDIDYVCNANLVIQRQKLDRKQRDELLTTLMELPNVTSVFIIAPPEVTDEDLRQLCTLRKLTRLVVVGPPITDSGLARLKNLNGLRSLGLWESRLTLDGAQAISQLPNLGGLNLRKSHLNNDVLRHIGTMKKLGYLSLEGSTGINDESLMQLSNLHELRQLDLTGAEISDRGLECLIGLPKLEMVIINRGNDPARFQSFRAARPKCWLRSPP
jgi:hypothetical protein